MFDISVSECGAIDATLEGKLAWAKAGKAEAEQLALDASRLLCCTENRLEEYAGQGFFKRCWFTLSGKTGALERANQADLVGMQKHAWRYINLLQERDLMLAHSMITVKNNLMTLAVDKDDMKQEITRLADKVYDRFIALDERIKDIEVSQNIHAWLLTIEAKDYDEKYPDNIRLLRVISDFYTLKPNAWTVTELQYLRKAIKDVGLSPKKKINISSFVNGIIGEIDASGYQTFSNIMSSGEVSDLDSEFIMDNISAPAFSSLHQIKDHYTSSSRVIRSLQKKLEISHAEAIQHVLADFIEEAGIDTSQEVPLHDLATELLSCLSLACRLSGANTNEAAAITEGNQFKAMHSVSGGESHMKSDEKDEGGNEDEHPRFVPTDDRVRIQDEQAHFVSTVDRARLQKASDYLKNHDYTLLSGDRLRNIDGWGAFSAQPYGGSLGCGAVFVCLEGIAIRAPEEDIKYSWKYIGENFDLFFSKIQSAFPRDVLSGLYDVLQPDGTSVSEFVISADESEDSTEIARPIRGALLKKIKSGDLYALLAVCTNDELDPIVKTLLGATTNFLEVNDVYKKFSPNHIMYHKEICDELRTFGGNSFANIFRGNGPEYSELVDDVCEKLDVKFIKGAVVANEKRLLQKYAEDMGDAGVEKVAAVAGKDASKIGNNKAATTVGIASAVLISPAGLLYTGYKISGAAFRVTVPCVLHIATLRQIILSQAVEA